MNRNDQILKIVKDQIKIIFENSLLLEADYKKKILEKFPIPDAVAEYVSERMGKLSIWFLNALAADQFDSDKKYFINYINQRPFWIRSSFDSKITKILDWIRHPLVAGTVELGNLTLQDALNKSDEFHENLKTLGGQINYQEQNKKLVEYDNDFYWAEIPSNYSKEECDRMGHCGRTSKGDFLFSLRSNLNYGKGNTINDSHLTVAYNTKDGLIYQSKGKKNSKPSEKYFPYFFDLILRLPKFNGFGREYQSSEDISLKDFSNDQLKQLLQKYPDVFKNYSAQKILMDRGLIEKIELQKTIMLNLKVDDIENYIRIDRDLRNDIIKRILIDPYDLYYNDYRDSWQYMVDDVNEENKKTIFEYIKNNFPEIDISGGDLEEIIKENEDDLEEVIRAINQAIGDAESHDYQNYCYNQLKNKLKEWGTLIELDDTGAVIEVNLGDFLDEVDEDYLQDAMERCNDDRECVFHEMVYDGTIEIPSFYLDDRYSPSADEEDFNQILIDTLDFQLSK